MATRLTKISPARAALMSGLAVILLASCLPIWTVHGNWKFHWPARGSLWEALFLLWVDVRKFRGDEFWAWHRTNIFEGEIVYALAWIIGAAVFLMLERNRPDCP